MQLNGVLYFEQHLTDAQLEAKSVSYISRSPPVPPVLIIIIIKIMIKITLLL